MEYPRESQPRRSFSIPGAIIIADTLVALAIIYTHKPSSAPAATAQSAAAAATQVSIAPISGADHILGNPNAPIKIVEYSDPSCPYCKMFNPIMTQVMDTYGPSGKVAWIYRHFPLDKPDQNGNILHPNAGHEAQALECAASLGGNDKFWAFEKKLYDVTPSVTPSTPNGLDQKQLPDIAKSIGLDAVSFNDCLSSGTNKTRVDNDYTDGINAGITGTPYSVMITPSGTKIALPGVQEYSSLKSAIDLLLNNTSGS